MPQPPSGGQHPGGGGGGDEGDGGGGGGDGSQFAEKGTGETSSVEKASGGKGSGRKDSGGKGSGGKGSGGKGSGGKRRTSGSLQYMETDPHCVGSRDFDMRDEATLTSDQVRVDSHLSARTLFSVAEDSPSRRAQQRSPVLNTLLLKEGASSFCLEGGMSALRRSEGATFGSLGSGDCHKLRIHSDLLTSPSAISAPHATVPRGQEKRAVHREEETQRWQSRKVLETGGSECERHASKGASVDTGSESARARGEMHALQQGEETRQGPTREDVKWLHARALVIGTSEEVLHSRGEPEVEGGEVNVDIRTDPQRKDGDCSPTHCGEEQGGRPSVLSTAQGMALHEAIELGDDSAATELVSDSGVAEMQNVESSVEGGEVTVSIKMDPERKDHDSPSTRCGAEQGDRASVLSTGREMVLHEPIDLPSDSAATELVSDISVAEVQNLESSVDVGAVARQEGEFPQKAPEHAEATSCFRVPLPTEELSATDLRMLRNVSGDFSNGHEVVSSVRKGVSSIPLSRKSLQTLIQGEWLSDEVVKSYLALLANAAVPGCPSLYIFSPFLYTKLVRGGYRHDRVAKWTKDVDIFSYEMVLIPVHKHGLHWTLLCLREQLLEYSDSLVQDDGGFSSDVIANFTQYLREEAVCHYGPKTKVDLQEPKVVVRGVPQQSDGSSCGVSMLVFASFLARGCPPPFSIAQSDIPNIWLRRSVDILQGAE
ncbi:hypothetical protein CBR_g39986 [Chara braunii]|uniref:Ubiquitin-like protease family profile domain-containing protein n=1 Tax=Chara braunii TaxID=69332 RepID=A0A388LSY2_CHABU|nr:hypothetical protein CBR_g39986 [Chara braunii]|eukprot:GBG85343.1 hypothetical protein CBR_g39986 [Chara braunii]